MKNKVNFTDIDSAMEVVNRICDMECAFYDVDEETNADGYPKTFQIDLGDDWGDCSIAGFELVEDESDEYERVYKVYSSVLAYYISNMIAKRNAALGPLPWSDDAYEEDKGADLGSSVRFRLDNGCVYVSVFVDYETDDMFMSVHCPDPFCGVKETYPYFREY